MASDPTTPAPSWHDLTADQATTRLAVDSGRGLTAAEADARLASHGPNRLPEKPPRPLWRLFLAQFKSLLILILIGAAVLAGAVGDVKDVVVILIVVLFNATLGFYQEYRAEQSLTALKKMLALKARVRRGGRVTEVAADTLVPGDIVLLEAGDRAPADGRLIAAHSLEIDESALTGESQVVGKHTGAIAETSIPLAERANMAYMNTVVTRGRAELLVTATGANTEMGRLAGMLEAAAEGPTPLQLQLDHLGKRLAIIAGGIVTLILVLGLWRGDDPAQIILTSIALAVAAIPEGLPAVVTVTLAIGMYRMARQNAIVKRLAAVETLGCTTVICSDKTGTLTLNQMTARAFYYRERNFHVTGEGYRNEGDIRPEDGMLPMPGFTALLQPLALCNDSGVHDGQLIGDPTEGALLVLAAKGGIQREEEEARLPRIAEIPFDPANKFMATFHRDGDEVRVFVKGAPDVLLARCARQLTAQGEQFVDGSRRAQLMQENEAMASRALRVLAVAGRTLPFASFDPAANLLDHIQDLTLAGLIGLMDPPRPEARDAIALCGRAGIAAKMITGDHKVTAAAIGNELGLHGEVITGAELDRLDNHALAARIEHITVFARVAPEHKVKIVQALKERGHIVAMTGDGVNDAPALKNADIGVAMGITGTEVAKEAATIVLTDDNFATLVRAVKEGRTIYDNIVKFVRFQLATNMGALLTVVSAPLLGLPIPFNPVQILWVNIIMDGPPAMALGVDPARPGLMNEPPRDPKTRILTLRRLGKLIAYGATMMAGTLGVLYYALQANSQQHALTLAFTTFVLFQFFNVFNARNEYGSAFTQNFFGNGMLWLALAGVLAMQVLVVHWYPAQQIFHTTDLALTDWGIAVAVASSVLWLEEARKLLSRVLGKR
ncbi:MAG: cation-translocating P-type ATPase [Gammaproteobacteria bacterium]|nr:cation-translocating P-type ATPase [Gammaproteobacteria bacterium]